MNKYEKFKEQIILNSISETYPEAINEWDEKTMYYAKEDKNCICGQKHIRDVWIIKNNINYKTLEIGSECITKLKDKKIYKKVFPGLKNIHKNIEKSINKESLNIFHSLGYLNDWELNFYYDIHGKKTRLSEKQKIKKLQINKKLLKITKIED